MNRFAHASCLAALLFAAAAVSAPAHADERTILSSSSFLDAHPDIKYRQLGLLARDRGDYEAAWKHLQRAASFADKAAQGALAEMLWKGEGRAADRAAAYAWMDLAAERGWRMLLVQREKYWAALTPAEQEAAVTAGEAIYAEYGDRVAQPRMEAKLRQGRKRSAGSRTGFNGNLKIEIDTPRGHASVDASDFYRADYWEPSKYWAWQAKAWQATMPGKVEVGTIKTADASN